MTSETFRCTRCRVELPVCEAQIRVKTTKDGVAGEASKKCKRCAESKKLASQRKRLAHHLEEEEEYDNLGSFPSLAHWRKALDDKVANGIFQVECTLRLPNQPVLTRQTVEIIAESFGDATSCRWK